MGKFSKEDMKRLKELRALRSKTSTGLEDFGTSNKAPVDPNAPGFAESALRGGAQGATFGFADEIAGGVQGVGQKLMGAEGSTFDLIRKNIQNQRASDAAAQEANPLTFGASEFTAGIAKDFLLPGSAALRGASFAKTAAATAGLGAVEAAGRADSLADIPKDAVIGAVLGGTAGPGMKLAGRALSGIGTAGRRKLGELGVTGKILGGRVSKDEDVFLRLATQGKRNLTSRSEKEFKKQAAAFAKADSLMEKSTGKGYVQTTGDGFGVEVLAEVEERQFSGLRKAVRAQRARVGGDLPNDLSILSEQMENRMIKLSNTKNAILRQAGEKIKNKTFSAKNLGIKDQLNESGEFLLGLPKGAKIKKILKADKKIYTFQEVNELEEFVSGALKNSWKDPIDSSVEKSLKGLRRSLVATQRDQVSRALGKKIGAKNNAIMEELSATITSSQEIFKASDQLFRQGSAREGAIGAPLVEQVFEGAAEGITNQGSASTKGIIKGTASVISAGLQAPLDVAGQALDSGASFIGSSEAVRGMTSALFPKGSLEDTGKVSLTDPMEKKMARHYNDQLPLRERSKANMLLNTKGEFDPNNVPKQLKKKYMINPRTGLDV